MPFDGSVLLRNRSLTHCTRELGITPIDPTILEAHKVEQLRRHPASWLIRHEVAVNRSVFVLVPLGIGCAYSSMLLVAPNSPFVPIFCFITCMWVVMVASRMKVRGFGPPLWEERALSDVPPNIPSAVAVVADEVREAYPTCTPVLGLLVRPETEAVLDPYLALEANGERVIVGIWDGRRVLHVARHG